MKKFSKLVLVIFSIIVLTIGIMINLLMMKWVDFDTFFPMVEKALTNSPSNKIILAVTEVSMLMALICIFFDSPENKDGRTREKDVLMQNNNGRLMISNETLENLVDSVIGEFKTAKMLETAIQLDKENNVSVLVDLTVTKDVIIKELTVEIQNKIKDTIKRASDLEVSEVNVRIKNIVENFNVQN